jgi:uncharacterized protein (TIRG00374 family)
MSNRTDVSGKARYGIWDVVKIILAVGLLGYVFTQTDFGQLADMVHRISPLWLALNFVLLAGLTGMKALQYHFITGRRSTYFRVLGIVVVQNALTNFVASTAGIASYLGMMSAEKDVRLSRATASFVIVKIADLAAVLILLAVFYVFQQPIPSALARVIWVVGGIAFAVVVAFLGIILFRRKFMDLAQALLRKTKMDQQPSVIRIMDTLSALAKEESSRVSQVMARATVFSFLYMATTLSWGYARLHTFSLDVDFGVIALVTCLLQLASWAPVFILGGLGVSESIAVYSLVAFGLGQSEVAAVLIAARLVFYLMNALMLLYIPLEKLFTQ